MEDEVKYSLDELFEYISENGKYHDREEEMIAGVKLSPEEERLQGCFTEFVFKTLPLCIIEGKFYYDEEDCFENYTLYLEYNGIRMIVYVLYGQGSYYTINDGSENFNEVLCYKV